MLVVVVADEPLHVRGQIGTRVVVHPRVPGRLKPAGEVGEDGDLFPGGVFLPDGWPGLVFVVALVGPVAVGVGGDGLPVDAGEGALGDDAEFVFAGEVVADVAVVDLAGPGVGGVLDSDPDPDGSAGSASEDVARFLLAKFACGSCVAAEVVGVDAGVFVCQGQADAVGGVAVEPAAVGDEGDDAFVADAVGGPAEGPQVGVVEAVLVRSGGACGVGVADPGVEGGVGDVGVEVVGGGLSDRVGRVADDDVDGGGVLAGDAFVVLGEDHRIQAVAVLGDLEGVGEDDAFERAVLGGCFFAGEGVVGGFDVDRGDVIREEHDLVGVELTGVFAGQILRGDESGLQ